MVDRLILASIALMLLSSAVGAKNVNSPICLPDLSKDEAFILIAEAGESAIVSKTATSIRFKPGYQVRIVKKDGRTFAVVATPGVSKETVIVECSCSKLGGGKCFPTLGGNPSVVTCTAVGCWPCTIKMTTPPEP
jgi:hypothetical protein